MTTHDVGRARVRAVRLIVPSAVLVLCVVLGRGATLSAQIDAEPSGRAVSLVFFNRPIVVLRARVLQREPAERAEAARRALDELVGQGITGPVEWHVLDGTALMSVAGHGVVALTRADIDELSGESVERSASRAASQMQVALAEALEARMPARLFRACVATAGVVLLAMLVLWGIARAHRSITRRLARLAELTAERSGIVDVTDLRTSLLHDVERWFIATGAAAVDAVVIYATISFALRRFPYTRPWGESMRRFLVTRVENLGLGVAEAIPGLLTVAIIFLVVRFLSRVIGLWFSAIERGRLKPRWIYPETAQPTRRLLLGVLWTFAVVVAYPYLPGSQTDAFKGVSVFFGLVVTFGSSGLVNQVVSGFMITYSRALRIGDFVRIGEVEGSVTHLGVLSTKVMTVRYEEVTIPNAVVVAQTTTDFSRPSGTDGVFTPTSVTIGYDAPWRQVQSLMLLAAERTSGVRRQPKPVVLQAALEDFYVRYTLLVCLDRQESRLFTLDALHAQIQDLFNEYGVQIMSPNYVVDPAAPKLVPRKDWYAAPAGPDPRRAKPTARAT